MWVCILGGAEEINRDERSARLHTHAHTTSTHKALLNFVLMYRLCLTGNDGWDTFLVIFRLLYFIARPIWSRRVIYHSHCMRSACLPYSCFVATCPAALCVLCTGHILQLRLTPLFQFIRRLSGDAWEKKCASAFVKLLSLHAQNASSLWKIRRHNNWKTLIPLKHI